jgi:hypothetical protein
MHDELFKTAERLLPKYGDVPDLALIQATILHNFETPWTPELVDEFKQWLGKI